jgi:hypothetical protein
VMYNPVGEGPKQITISPDPTYQFADFDTLRAGQEQAYADLQAALRQTANQMGTLVR